jgi:hypothetical protein
MSRPFMKRLLKIVETSYVVEAYLWTTLFVIAILALMSYAIYLAVK